MSLLLACRFANVGIFILATGFYYVRSNDLWAGLQWGVRLKRVGILLLLFMCAGGSANAYLEGIRPTWPIPFFTAAGLMVLGGLWFSRGHRDPQH